MPRRAIPGSRHNRNLVVIASTSLGQWAGIRVSVGPECVRVEEVPTPSAGPGEVLVRVRACGLNRLDLWVLGGLPALKTPLPFWTGCDIAGEVAALGPGVTGVSPGARVGVNPSLS